MASIIFSSATDFGRALSRTTWGAFCILLWLCGPAAAKMPELGGPKQFDLLCQGHVEHVLDAYIPVPMAGPGGDIPKVQAVQRHIIVDLQSMHFEDVHKYNSGKDKIALEKDGLLYLMNERGFRRWVINLDSYKSIYVMEEQSGDLWVEKMQCRPAKFSGIPAGLPEFPPGGAPSAAPWVFQRLMYENKITPVSPQDGSGNVHY